MKIGSHVSIRHGYYGAASHAFDIGATAFQYFPKNPRSIQIKDFNREDAERCAAFCQEKGLVSVAHTPYPTSLCVDREEDRQGMIDSIRNDLDIADACGSIGIVVHFGKHHSDDPLEGYQMMISMLDDILEPWEGDTLLLLENNAGQGLKMGTTLEELVQVRELCQYPSKIGFCLDTCHAFASGIWNGENWEEVVEKGSELGFFEDLKVVHLNDSRYPTQSYRDRHANVGKGEIGEAAFRAMLNANVMQTIPCVLETPKSDTYTHKDEIQYVNTLLKGDT
ncbi:deoxyribonuclease IV [Caldalkalibacillus salinus]|uniref:deoxyribonuclease IV n=1 Tax=Caldalkalibacillus salinus TaxID=2803787 RepID=UPI001922CFBA|nr:deoxyribonuclease IV [Caldalkalibacillus salinus]